MNFLGLLELVAGVDGVPRELAKTVAHCGEARRVNARRSLVARRGRREGAPLQLADPCAVLRVVRLHRAELCFVQLGCASKARVDALLMLHKLRSELLLVLDELRSEAVEVLRQLLRLRVGLFDFVDPLLGG